MLRKIILLLMVLTLLSGCRQQEPAAMTQPPLSTAPEQTEPPAQTRPIAGLDAEAIYRKMALTASNKWLTSYSRSIEVVMESADISYRMDTAYTVSMASAPLKIYQEVESKVDVDGAGMEMTLKDASRYYVRYEGSVPVTYLYSVTYDQWYRYEMEGTAADIMYGYSSFGVADTTPPEEITLDEATQMTDGREAYVLRFTRSGEEIMGQYAGNVSMEYVCYVDMETFMLLKQEIVYDGMDEYIMDTIRDMVGMADIGDENLFTRMEMRETMTNITVEPVEVQEVPQEAIDNSLDITDIPEEESGGQYL